MLQDKKESTKSIFLMAFPMIIFLGLFVACEKKVQVVSLDQSAQNPDLEINDQGQVVVRDTIITFNDDTYEETMQIITNTMTLEEYQASHAGLSVIAEESDGHELITVTDTIVIFNDDTYEEEVRIAVSYTHLTLPTIYTV